MSNDTIAQRKARAIEKLTNDRDAAIARAAQLEADNYEIQDYINEIRVALHTEKDELTIEAAKRIVAERDEARYELNTLHIESEAHIAQLEAERDEQKQRADILEHACEKALNERDVLHADMVQCVSDARKMAADLYHAQNERDELRRQLEQAHAIIAEQRNTIQDATP